MPKKPKKAKTRKTKNLFRPFSRDENGLNLICQILGLQGEEPVPVEYQDAVLVSSRHTSPRTATFYSWGTISNMI
jgi:hypothetical protein